MGKLKDLYNGELSMTWLDNTTVEGEEYVFITPFMNALTFSMPKEDFQLFVEELMRASKMLQLLDKPIQAK